MNDMFELSGKVAVVTGGSRGIGKMIAEEFVRRGVRTYITSRKADACEATARELSEYGECIAIPQDLSTTEGIAAFAGEIRKRESKIDILINNAGAAWGAPFDEFPEKGWDKVMDVNLKSVFFLCQKLMPLLRSAASAERPAKVINIASIDGIRNPDTETYSYVASKAGLIHLTRRMAKRLAQDHVHVNAIAPGAFPSEMNVWARDEPEKVASRIPAGRVGQAQDIAGAAVYMCSRAGDYLVGITLPVDGGVTLAV
jgi:2-deoxy-D-gluconate 3-dehydrogenase